MLRRGQRQKSSTVKDLGLAQQIRRVVWLVAGIVGVAMLVAVSTLAILLTSVQPELSRNVDAALGLQRLHEGMLDEETSIRGYLAVRDNQFLENYRAGVQLVTQGSDSVRSATERDAALDGLFVNVEVARQTWSSDWALPTIASPPLVDDANGIEVAIAQDKAKFSGYVTAEAALADALSQRIQGTSATERLVLLLGVFFEALVCVALVVLGVRQHRGLANAVVAPVNGMLEGIGAVAHGNLDVTFESRGPLELQQIAGGLSDMTHALKAERALSSQRENEIREQSERLRQIVAMSRDVAGSLSLRYVVQAVAISARVVTEFPRIVVWLVDESKGNLRPVYDTDGEDGSAKAVEPLELGEGTAGRAAKYGRLMIGHTESLAANPATESMSRIQAAAMPMIVGARIVGVIELRSVLPRDLTTAHLDSFEMLSTQAATAVEAARLHRDAEDRSRTDPLTRLFNRRRLDEDLAKECEWSMRQDRPLSFIMLDVDHFKRFNDTYGHQRADEVLQELALVLTSSVRTADRVYRYGGEELAVLLRDTPVEEASMLAERLRARIAERFELPGQPCPVTASFGVASMPLHAASAAELVATADTALYAAKHAGRNRVVTADGPDGGGPVRHLNLAP